MKRILLLCGVVVAALTAAEALNPAPVFIWNQTASIERGLYIQTNSNVETSVTVAVSPPPNFRNLLQERRYLPSTVPLMKRVVAADGDQICRIGDEIILNQEQIARAKEKDSAGRILPEWQGCFVLSAHEVFLLGSHENSLDGRYFGPVRRESIIGTYRLIWRVGG